MQHLKYTYVDARTGVPCTEAAMRAGPAMPNVPGLQFGFALESLYPTATPVFYGTAPAAELSTPGVLELVSEAEYDAARDQEQADRLAKAKAARLDELAAYRWQIETGGIVRNGVAIATDDRSQAKISGALQLVQDDPQVVIDWKADNGWVQLNAAAVTYIAREIGLHVQACFSREKALATAINACATVAEVAAVDITSGWPSNTAEPE